MSVLALIKASKTASKLNPSVAINIKKLEGIKGSLTKLNIATMVDRSDATLTPSQRESLLRVLKSSDKFKGSDVEHSLQRFENMAAKDNPNSRFLAERESTLDASIHRQVLTDLLDEQPDATIDEALGVNPFPQGMDSVIPVPDSSTNVLGKIQDKLKNKGEVDFTTLIQVPPRTAEVVNVDFTTLRPVKADIKKGRD